LSFSIQAGTAQKRTENLLAENRRYVFSAVPSQQQVPQNIDTQVREYILKKFGGVEVEKYGDRIERKLFTDSNMKDVIIESSSDRMIHYAEQFADIPETIV
jgi:hypothetical protein